MKRDPYSFGRALLALLIVLHQFRLDKCVYAFQPSIHTQMMWSRIHQNVARFNEQSVSLMATPTRNANGTTNSDSEAVTNILNEKESNPTNIEQTGPSSRILPSNWLGEKVYILFTAALIGLTTGTNIAVFKKAVECVREIMYGDGIPIPPRIEELIGTSLGSVDGGEQFFSLSEKIPLALAPAVGGLLVGILLKMGGDLPPGLRDSVTEGMY